MTVPFELGDVYKRQIVVTPVVENTQKIKETIEGLLVPIQIVLDTLHQSVVDTFSKILEVYATYVSPFITCLLYTSRCV